MKSIDPDPPPKSAAPAPPLVKNAPLPPRAAMRKAATDLLYENVEPALQGSAADVVCDAPRKRPRHRPRAIVAAPLPPARAVQSAPLVDSGDKLHRVAVVADLLIEAPRAPRPGRAALVPAPRPKSKAECERRCGSDGFCDPSDPVGCGGMYCGRPSDR